MITEKQLANLRPFSSTHQPKVYGKRGASPLTAIKKYLTKMIDVPDPITKEQRKMAIGEVIGLQWLSKAFKGEGDAVKDILDRIDGRVAQKLIGEGFGNSKIIIVREVQKKDTSVGDKTQAVPR